ncbi:hypothetical protein Tco_0855017 [Tanacetum coccineum]
MHRNIAWDKVEDPNPQSTPQVPPSFEETTPPVTHPEEVDETIGIPTEVEPLDYMKLVDIGLNTCSYDLFLSSREVPSFDEPEPQLQPFPHDPKKHYGFKSGLLEKSISLGVDISNWEMFDDGWGLESKEVSPLGEELSLFDRENKVERGRIIKAHHLEPILQQQNSQCMAPSHHDGNFSSKTKILFSQTVETASRLTRDSITTTPVTGSPQPRRRQTPRLYLMRRSLEVLRKFHWMILGRRFNQLSHVSFPLLSKPGEY